MRTSYWIIADNDGCVNEVYATKEWAEKCATGEGETIHEVAPVGQTRLTTLREVLGWIRQYGDSQWRHDSAEVKAAREIHALVQSHLDKLQSAIEGKE